MRSHVSPRAAILISHLAGQGEGTLRIRIHGDLHLGQILVAQDDAYFIDFEGEPARPLSERRAKQSPLRDVAGMLRSFDYAVAVAPQPAPDNGEAAQLTRDLLQQFRAGSSDAFLAEYRSAAAALPHRGGVGAMAALIDLFELEKAAYELVYEATNRPDWVAVPLRGLATIVARLVKNYGE